VVKAIIDYIFLNKIRLKPEARKAKARAARMLSINATGGPNAD